MQRATSLQERRPLSGVGLIGGPGVEEATYYARLIEEEIAHRFGEGCVAPLFTLAWRTPRFARRFESRPRDVETMARAAQHLKAMGAQAIALCGSRKQLLAAELSEQITVISMCGAVRVALTQSAISRIGVVGTSSEDEAKLWRTALQHQVRDVRFPTPTDQAHLQRIMNEEFERGLAAAETRADVIRIAISLRQAGARALVVCLPELTRLLEDAPPTLPIFDATEYHVRAIVDWMAGER